MRLFYIIDVTMSPAAAFLGSLWSDSTSESAISMAAVDGSDDDSDARSLSDEQQESG